MLAGNDLGLKERTMRRHGRWATLLAGLLLSGSAAADEWDDAFDRDRLRESRGADDGINVRLNAGIGNYTGDLSSHTGTGPTWGVAVGLRAWNLLAGELAYEGSRNGIDDTRLSSGGAAIWRNGLSAMAMIAPEVTENLRPYLGAGLGASYINPSEDAEIAYRNDFVTEVPLAAGVDYQLGILNAGVRATYRVLFGEEFAEPTSGPSTQGGLLTATLNLGGRF
jgi:hypothetical protein